jgi:hypothetical protein
LGRGIAGLESPAPAGITEILPGRCDSRSTQDRFLGILDEKRVNVLKFNLALRSTALRSCLNADGSNGRGDLTIGTVRQAKVIASTKITARP